MPWMIDCTDRPGAAELRQKTRAQHLAYAEQNVGLIIAAGAKLADDGVTAVGTLYLIDVDDRAAAEAFAAGDPYSKAGVFGSVVVTRWRKGFFDRRRIPPQG
jgi:uncharacterized protein YciI